MTRRHHLGGCEVPVPGDWSILPGQGEQRLIAVEPLRSTGQHRAESDPPLFRANLVFTVVDNGTLSFRDWQVGTDELLPQQLPAYQLIDLERRPVGGHPGGRRLAQHVVDDVTPVTMEQWFTQVGTLGYTLTCTVDTWRYDAMADGFAELADALVLPAAAPTEDIA